MQKHDIIIIGGGPAGYTAAIYASRAGLQPVVIEGPLPGGQLTTTTIVENYPGFPNGIDGISLVMQMREQAERLGANLVGGIVDKVSFHREHHSITLDDGSSFECKALIIATGAEARYLGLPSEERLKGRGVSACATCDGFFYKGKTVAVVGGGDTAAEEALYLASITKKVFLIVRRNQLRASEIMQRRLKENDKIEILFEHQTKEILGNEKVEGAILIFKAGTPEEEVKRIDIDGFFLAIGHTPKSQLFLPNIEVDEEGYVKTKVNSTQTNIDGVFACGDVADPTYRQCITAAASGCKAAFDAKRYLGI
ncbi:MAG: thioredoxin-disulfide reductase [Marinilabiliaceae bacterium]|nr:thioredoxin-disulfide reductase [Marinilabiliaceae bacterium]